MYLYYINILICIFFWNQIKLFLFVCLLYKFRIDFPREVIRGESLFTNLVIDETTSSPENNCNDAFVYITDTVEPGQYYYYDNDIYFYIYLAPTYSCIRGIL